MLSTSLRMAIGVFFVFTSLTAKGVSFKKDSFEYTAKVTQSFEIDLVGLLSDQGNNRVWSTDGKEPSWLTLDTTNERLFGTPQKNDVGSTSFQIRVRDGEKGAISQITIEVLALPLWSEDRIDLGLQKEGMPFSFDLNTKVTDPAGGTLTFTASNLPSWLNLNPNGTLSGTPQRVDVGAYDNIVFTATGVGGSASATGFGEVLKVIKPPKWTGNPITLPNGFEDQEYNQGTANFVSNPEGTPLTFTKLDGPAWAEVSNAGRIVGTPREADIGDVSVRVQFRTTVDGKVFEESTVFRFAVEDVNKAPTWNANPIDLPNAFTGVTYSQDLGGAFSDPDTGDTHTITISGPAWLQASADGKLTGTPAKSDVGVNTWTATVTDKGGLSDTTTVRITVIKSNEPPYWTETPVVLPIAKEDFAYAQDLAPFAKDPDNDTLTFTKLEGPAWLSVGSNGMVTGTPKKNDVGLNKFKVRVADNISGSAVAEVLIDVEKTNHAPYWVLNPIFFQVKELDKVSLSVAPYAKDDDDDELQFTKITGADWLTLSTDGTFTGSAGINDAGKHEFNVRVSDGTLTADTKVIVEVLNVNQPPKWTKNPIVLPDANERESYTQNIAQYATDPDLPKDTQRFSKVSGPDWVNVDNAGNVSGTPQRKDLGLNKIEVRVMDEANEFAITTVHVTVNKVNLPPRWRQNPVLLDDAFEDTAYNFSLEIYAVDDDGDDLTFSKVGGPDWLTVSPEGIVGGTPTEADLGDFTARLAVSDGQVSVEVDAQGKVLPINHAPIIHEIKLTAKERETSTFNLWEKQYVEDPDNDDLTFTLLEFPDWVKLDADGKLSVTPRFEHVNNSFNFKFRVNDGELYTEGTIEIAVERNPRAPIWLQDPLNFTARTNERFEANVSDQAKDLDNLTLTFETNNAPDWLSLSSNGQLSGTPADSDVGTQSFAITARNDVLGADVTVNITVKLGTVEDKWQIDEPVDGATAENLWVVDNSNTSRQLTQSLRNCIHHYYDTLDDAGIEHEGILISSDPDAFKGEPIADKKTLLSWDDEDVVSDFRNRVDWAWSKNCCNSPIWSISLFKDLAKNLDVYKQDYLKKGTPNDTLIVTRQADYFKHHAKNTSKANWTTDDYSEDFQKFYRDHGQPYRISAIAPKCPKLVDFSKAGSGNAYENLVSDTSGKYYAANCKVDMPKVLKDFARDVIFRAYVSAKRFNSLSQTPMDPSTITVKLGSTVLPGNTGGDGDQWRYDAAQNRVEIFWEKIDLSAIPPGSNLVIRYRIS